MIALPRKLMVSIYVPGATMISSPFNAMLIAAWMVGWSSGTLMMSALAEVTKATANDAASTIMKLVLLILQNIE